MYDPAKLPATVIVHNGSLALIERVRDIVGSFSRTDEPRKADPRPKRPRSHQQVD